MAKKKKLTLTLNEEEAEDLLRLVFLGGWMISSYDMENPDHPEDETEQSIYRQAFENGMKESILYEKENDRYYVDREILDDLFEEVIGKYNWIAFAVQISDYLAGRMIKKKPELKKKLESDSVLPMRLHMKFRDRIIDDYEDLIEYIGKYFDGKVNM